MVEKNYSPCYQWFSKRKTSICICICIVSSLLFTSASAIAKALLQNDSIHKMFLVFCRMFFMATYVTPMATANSVGLITSPQLGQFKWILLLRCAIGSCGVLLYFTALDYLPLAEAGIVFNATAPVWSTILSRVVLKEKFRLWDLLIFVLTLSGVILILHPPIIFSSELVEPKGDISFHDRVIGISCGICGGFCQVKKNADYLFMIEKQLLFSYRQLSF